MKEIEDDTNSQQDISCSWIGGYYYNNHTIQEIYRFNAIPIKYQWHSSQNQNKQF